VVAFNDKTANEVVHVSRLNNLSIPDDISLIGFDDPLFCTVLSPKLTSIKYPIEEMAAYAVELSLKLTQKDTYVSPCTHLFMPTVVERESVMLK
jgi:LacI family transcriptional regulator